MSQILRRFNIRQDGWYLILDCYHWYHWTGIVAPEVDSEFNCPNCNKLPEPMIIKEKK